MATPRLVSITKAPQEEGLYFRVGYNDHAVLSRLIAERRLRIDGVVLDARRHERHASLRKHAEQTAIAACLDTQAMELAMPGTNSKGHGVLPWAEEAKRSAEELSSRHVERITAAIVDRVAEGHYSEVMAPAHYLSEEGSAWLDADDRLTRALRAKLNSAGHASIRITYPLAVHHTVFYDRDARAVLQRALTSLPIDAVSLRVQPFGNDTGPLALRNFIEACWDFPVGVPLTVERAGLLGLAAYALGAVDRVETGITIGDSFDIGRLQRPAPRGRRSLFSPPHRVYLEALGTTVDQAVAAELMSSGRGKTYFACRDRLCCPNGFRDMLADPQRHSALARQRQFGELSRVPRTMRAEHLLQSIVGPVCDMLSRAGTVHDRFSRAHRRMISTKEMLLDLQRERKRQHHGRRELPDFVSSSRSGGRIIEFRPRDPRGR